MHAFLQVQNKLQLEAVTNLVSVGDSHIEMDAVHLLGRSFAHALVKTVKLWERPTPYELQKQVGGRALDEVAPQVGLLRVQLLANRWVDVVVNDLQPPAHEGQVKLARKRVQLREIQRVALDMREHADWCEAPCAILCHVLRSHSPQ